MLQKRRKLGGGGIGVCAQVLAICRRLHAAAARTDSSSCSYESADRVDFAGPKGTGCVCVDSASSFEELLWYNHMTPNLYKAGDHGRRWSSTDLHMGLALNDDYRPHSSILMLRQHGSMMLEVLECCMVVNVAFRSNKESASLEKSELLSAMTRQMHDFCGLQVHPIPICSHSPLCAALPSASKHMKPNGRPNTLGIMYRPPMPLPLTAFLSVSAALAPCAPPLYSGTPDSPFTPTEHSMLAERAHRGPLVRRLRRRCGSQGFRST